jgi:hypothetical protein
MNKEDLNPEIISDWVQNDITQLFFGQIREEVRYYDSQVHTLLESNKPEEAQMANAAKFALENIVLKMADIMVEEAKQERENRKKK